MYQPCQRPMGWYAAPLTTWQETYPSNLAIENAKAPDLRTGIVLKSGAKVERMLRYAFSAECAKLNSAETREGQNHRLAPLYQHFIEI